MKILLTGVTGFLGSHLAAALIHYRHEVLGLKRRHSDTSRLAEISNRIHLIDLEEGLDSASERHPGIELIIHTATVYGYNQESASDIVSANVVMPLRLLEWAGTNGIRAFINTDSSFSKASSTYTYLSNYIASKKCFVQLGTRVANSQNTTFCNMRIEHMFGPHDSEQKFTTHIVRQLLNGTPEIELTPGQQERDFVFVDDVVSAYMCVIGAIESNSIKGMNNFEVGSGMAHTILEFVTMAHRIARSKSRLVFGALPYRENEIMHFQANLDALRVLGWSPKIKLDVGIELLVKSLRPYAGSS